MLAYAYLPAYTWLGVQAFRIPASFASGIHATGGSPAPDPLRRLPPLPPPPPLEIGPKVPDHGRRRRPKQILLEPVEDEKMGYHPMCLYSKYSVL